jgi:uncharacterized membrane protein
MCLTVSRNTKSIQPGFDEHKYNLHLLKRGLKILGLGILFTIITMIFIPDRPIFFGVLHCIGLSIILLIPFLKIKTYAIFPGIVSIIIGIIIYQFPVEHPTLFQLILGFHPTNIAHYTIDYFPLFPWLGVCLMGITVGNLLYHGNKRRFGIPDLSGFKPATWFSWLGKHSLVIYLVHQPIIAGALTLIILL